MTDEQCLAFLYGHRVTPSGEPVPENVSFRLTDLIPKKKAKP
jgi:hypothetical protein